jgi:sec-independent protein translocase protein TatC
MGMPPLESRPSGMYLLKKAIQLREKSHPDHEKPFLEHLEDLRTMIFRIVITLVISMILCFTFNKKLMEFFRHPVDQVLVTQTRATLPDDAPRPFTVETWEKARKVERAAMNLTPEQRGIFYRSLGDEALAFQAKSVSIYRAASALPEDKREGFVNSLDETKDLKLQVEALLKTKPKVDGDSQGNLKMMSALKPTEGFMLSMKLSFVAGIVVSFPLLLMFILQFVLPGLHSNEKRVLWPAMAVGFGLFLCGTVFAYYLVLPRTLLFFYQWSGDMGISNDWRIGEYISFATQFTLLFGVAFELPVVVMVFVKLGLLGYETMSKTRSYAVVAIFVAAAVLTPTPDIATMCVMAAPMIILYEICIWLAWFDRRKRLMLEEQEARERAESQTDADEQPQQDPYADESGDDGWPDEFPQQNFHDSPKIPGDEPEPGNDGAKRPDEQP